MLRLRTVCAVLAIVCAIATPAAADRLDEVKARGKLIVGVSDTTPPFSFKRPGDNVNAGYDIDIVRGVAKRLGVALEMVSLSSAERIPLLQQGKLDFVATSMTRTAARLRDVDFSYIYFVTPHAVIVKKSSGITSVHQLAGRKASSASTSTAGDNLKEAEPAVNVVYVRDYAIAFAALKDGSVDAFPDRRKRVARNRAAGRTSRRLRLPVRLHEVAQCRLRHEEGRTPFQGGREQSLAGYRSVGRSRPDIRPMARRRLGSPHPAHVHDQSRLKRRLRHSCLSGGFGQHDLRGGFDKEEAVGEEVFHRLDQWRQDPHLRRFLVAQQKARRLRGPHHRTDMDT